MTVMLRHNLWLCLVVVLCVVSLATAAIMEYKEPDMEVDTSMPLGDPSSTDEKTKDEENGGEGEEELMDNDDGDELETAECKVKPSCIVTDTLKEMAELIKELNSEIKSLQVKVETACSAGGKEEEEEEDSSEESKEDGNGSGSGDGKEDDGSSEDNKEEGSGGEDDDNSGEEKDKTKCKEDQEVMEGGEGDDGGSEEEGTIIPEPTLPPPPESCPPPFQLLADSCYYIQTDGREWRSWGDAQSFCQQQSGTLAAPYRVQQLREYLQTYYTSVFWVGARFDSPDWVWVNGNKMAEDDWKTGMPSRHPSKLCVYLDYWNNYKGVSHFCGEKFSFICEYRPV